jgi:hypothetical protein
MRDCATTQMKSWYYTEVLKTIINEKSKRRIKHLHCCLMETKNTTHCIFMHVIFSFDKKVERSIDKKDVEKNINTSSSSSPQPLNNETNVVPSHESMEKLRDAKQVCVRYPRL